MILDLSVDIIRNEIIPYLDDRSLGRLSLSCKLLHIILSPRLFTRRSLYKIRTKKDFWKINLDRHWKMKCPLNNREYHVVCEKHNNQKFPDSIYIELTNVKIKNKINVLEQLTIIADINIDKQLSYTILSKDAKCIIRISSITGRLLVHDHFADIEKLYDDKNNYFAFHLEFNFPFLLYYLQDEKIEIEILGFILPIYDLTHIPVTIKNFILKGYKIKQLCNFKQCKPENCFCKFHLNMNFFIRLWHPSPSNFSVWNIIRYQDGKMYLTYLPSRNSIADVKSPPLYSRITPK